MGVWLAGWLGYARYDGRAVVLSGTGDGFADAVVVYTFVELVLPFDPVVAPVCTPISNQQQQQQQHDTQLQNVHCFALQGNTLATLRVRNNMH